MGQYSVEIWEPTGSLLSGNQQVGRYLDNIFIERVWRSLKQEAIYLSEITDEFQARRIIKDWIAFYNTERPHSAIDRLTSDDAYWAVLEKKKAA